MFQKALEHCASLSLTRVLFFGIVLAIAIEAFTIWMRFGVGLQFTRDTGLIGSFTFDLRIHHGYLGVVVGLLTWWVFRNHLGSRNLVFMVAIALIASDIVHHFLVLWPVTSSPQFHLMYPRQP